MPRSLTGDQLRRRMKEQEDRERLPPRVRKLIDELPDDSLERIADLLNAAKLKSQEH